MTSPSGKIRSFLILQPRNDDYAALVAFFEQKDVLGKAMRLAGAHACELHVPLSGTGPVVVTALWDSEAAYAVWRAHPIRDELSPGLAELIDDSNAVLSVTSGLYQVALATS